MNAGTLLAGGQPVVRNREDDWKPRQWVIDWSFGVRKVGTPAMILGAVLFGFGAFALCVPWIGEKIIEPQSASIIKARADDIASVIKNRAEETASVTQARKDDAAVKQMQAETNKTAIEINGKLLALIERKAADDAKTASYLSIIAENLSELKKQVSK